MMKGMRRFALCAIGVCAMCAAMGVASAGAALPEIGRCVAVEATKEGKKTVHSGGFTHKNCSAESPTHTGKYEFLPGPGAEPTFEGSGSGESVTLTTPAGHTILCGVAETKGEYTGAKTSKLFLLAEACEDTNIKKPCQSFVPEEKEVKPIEGVIKTLPLKGELGYISGGGTSKPTVGWDYSPEVGSIVATFECGTTLGLGEKVTLEGSYIPRVKNPLQKMAEEFHFLYSAVGGKQVPEQLEGGAKDTLTAKFVTGLESTTEEIGYSAKEEVETEEPYEYRVK